jgi:hypothetical protein
LCGIWLMEINWECLGRVQTCSSDGNIQK